VTVRIDLSSVCVDDQDKALAFYTGTLGFQKKLDIPLGAFGWITVVAPDAPDGVQLVLEPNDNPAARTFQAALHEQGIPWTSFGVDDIAAEHERLEAAGVKFRMPPTKAGTAITATFDDTCGNLIGIHEVIES
jgi:predicted enzyme related to lactoylglutathione lyase